MPRTRTAGREFGGPRLAGSRAERRAPSASAPRAASFPNPIWSPLSERPAARPRLSPCSGESALLELVEFEIAFVGHADVIESKMLLVFHQRLVLDLEDEVADTTEALSVVRCDAVGRQADRKSTRLNSSHLV